MAYLLDDYSAMLADRSRVTAYLDALRAVIRPGMTVLDLGAGTGFFSFEACRLGARRVYAIDNNPTIKIARDVAAANALQDRIVFLEADALTVTLPEPVDVIVSDLRGSVPLTLPNLQVIYSARRFLKPDGVLVPWRDHLVVTVIEAADVYLKYLRPWDGREGSFTVEPLVQHLANTIIGGSKFPVGHHLTTPAVWATADYRTMTSLALGGEVHARVLRKGIGHGLNLWFDAELVDGIGFTSGPDEPDSVYGTPFLPWPRPVPLEEGDVIDLELRAEAIGADRVWNWSTRIVGTDGAVRATFVQSTFLGLPVSIEDLRRQSQNHRPNPTLESAADRFILEQFDGHRSVREIAAAAAERFPDRFGPGREALAHTVDLASRYRA